MLGVSAARARRLGARCSRTATSVYNDIAAPGRGHLLDAAARAHSSTRPAARSRATRTAGRSSSGTARGRRSRRRRSSAAAALLFAQRAAARSRTRSRTAHALGARRERRQRLRPLLGRPRLAHRLGHARRRRARSDALDGTLPDGGPLRGRTTRPAPLPRSGAEGGSASQRRSTTGTTRSTSTRSGFGAASAWWRARGARAALDTNLLLWKPGTRRVDRLPRSIAACSRRSPGRRARSSESACARRRPAGTSSRSRSRPPGAGKYSLKFRKRRSGGAPEQLVRSDLADLPRRVADDDRPRRDVSDDDRAGADECLLADLDPGQRTAAPPTRAPRRIVGPRRSSCRARCGP